MYRSPKSLLPVASLLFLAPDALAGVLTVAPSGAAYTEIAAAVGAAVDGDVILVRSGGYATFAIDGKSISVVADAGADVNIYDRVFVRNIASSQTAVLSGISITRPFLGSALRLESNAGRVRVQSVTAIGGQYVFGDAWPGLEISDCADASFVGCAFTGGNPENGGLGHAHNGAPGIRATSSVVTLHDCIARGGPGLYGYSNPPGPITWGQPGLPGAELVGGQLFARGSTFQGGAGGRGADNTWCPTTPYEHSTGGGNGGPGIRATGAAVALFAVTATGGAGGIGGTNGCGAQSSSGTAGLPVDPATIVPQSGPQMTMDVPAPVREGGLLTISVIGPVGHRVILATSAAAGFAPVFQGVLLLQPPLRRLQIGTIPPAGFLDVNLPVPALPAGIQVRQFHAQVSFVDPSTGQAYVTTSSVVFLLDASL